MRKYLILVLCVVIGLTVYIFSPLGTHKDRLASAQIESLCDYFAAQASSNQYPDIENTCQAAVKIFGTEHKDDNILIYGYASAGEYLKHKDKAYDVGGFNEVFMIEAMLADDALKIVKEYGDGNTTQGTLNEMPFKYRMIFKTYDPYDKNGYCIIGKEADKKVEEVLGVPVERGCSLSISGKEYEIFDIDTDGNIKYFEKGKRKDF